MYNAGTIYSLNRMKSLSSVKTHDHKTQEISHRFLNLNKAQTIVTKALRDRGYDWQVAGRFLNLNKAQTIVTKALRDRAYDWRVAGRFRPLKKAQTIVTKALRDRAYDWRGDRFNDHEAIINDGSTNYPVSHSLKSSGLGKVSDPKYTTGRDNALKRSRVFISSECKANETSWDE